MREWQLGASDPLQLVLASDSRQKSSTGSPHETGDISWEIQWGGGDAPAFAVQSTMGLRASALRFFPIFSRLGKVRQDPEEFHSPPVLVHFLPSWYCFTCEPFEGLQTRLEFFAISPHQLTGRIQIVNKTILPQFLRIEWAGMLSPHGEGEGLACIPADPGYILTGRSGSWQVVSCLTGGTEAGKTTLASLTLQEELFPSAEFTTQWSVAVGRELPAVTEQARQALAVPWDARLARIELSSAADTLNLYTGIGDWDAAFAFSQKTARDLLMPLGEDDPALGFVHARQPDLGFNPRAHNRGSSSVESPAWGNQSGLDCYHLSSLLTPDPQGVLRGWIENFLHAQSSRLPAERSPSHVAQRAALLPQPLLATLALRAAPLPEGDAWLTVMFPGLLHAFRNWLDQQHDPDQDGLPEWESPLQTGLTHHPLFDRWNPAALGMDITMVESPALGAMLYQECSSLISIARRLGQEEELPWLSRAHAQIMASVEDSWDRKSSSYVYRDSATHLSLSSKLLVEFKGNGPVRIHRKLRAPQRLVIQLSLLREGTRAIQIHLSGINENGEAVSEEILPRMFAWSPGSARATTRTCFLQIEAMEVNGVQEDEGGRVLAAGLDQLDISLLLPLWAGIPSARRAEALVQNQVMAGWLQGYGLGSYPPGEGSEPPRVELPWNSLVIEGLLRYGYRTEAAELFTRGMAAVVKSLRTERNFQQAYLAETGSGSGERAHLWGLAPLAVFLRVVGIELHSSTDLTIRGFNPFPWPVTVQYQRLQVTREGDQTRIDFSGRAPKVLSGTDAVRITYT